MRPLLPALSALVLAIAMAGCDPVLDTSCDVPADCQLINGCCDCMAIHVDETAPECHMMECFATECSGEFGTNAVHATCVDGGCVVELDEEP